MPLFWSAIGGKAITLTNVIANDSVVMYQPQISFADATDVEISNQELTLSNKNMFVWKGAIVVTLQQSGFQFDKYPGDTQDIILRFYMYPYNNLTAKMSIFAPIAFSSDQNGQKTFTQNPLWTYVNSSSTTYNSQGSSSSTSYALFTISMSRQGSGIVLRLVIPVFLLLILSTLTFWADFEERVNITITILLAVSALYIVILGNIPLVGYLTSLDKFIFWVSPLPPHPFHCLVLLALQMFLLLVVVVILHQVYATLHTKLDRWPMRIFYLRVVECVGRTGILPAIVLYFFQEIPAGANAEGKTAIIAVIITATGIIFIRELFGLKSSWKHSMILLIEKVNAEETLVTDLSWVEILVVNITRFHEFSTSPMHIGKVLQSKDKLAVDFVSNVRLRNIAQVDDFFEKKPVVPWTILSVLSKKRKTSAEGAATLHKARPTSDVQMTTFSRQEIANPIFTQDLSQGIAVGSALATQQAHDVENGRHPRRSTAMESDSDDES